MCFLSELLWHLNIAEFWILVSIHEIKPSMVSAVSVSTHMQLNFHTVMDNQLGSSRKVLKTFPVVWLERVSNPIHTTWFVVNQLQCAKALAGPFNGDAHQLISHCSHWWYTAVNHTLFPNIFFALNSLWLRYKPYISDECSTFSR